MEDAITELIVPNGNSEAQEVEINGGVHAIQKGNEVGDEFNGTSSNTEDIVDIAMPKDK